MSGKITVTEDEFGYVNHPISDDRELVKRFTFRNDKEGLSIQIITYGATITSIKIPDKNGHISDIVLGFDNMEGYISKDNPYFGATIGRVCNRINEGKFLLNGENYQVSKNMNNKHHLHGGFIGFDKYNWYAYKRDNKVTMTHVNDDGREGYPGTVIATVTFELKSNNQFCTSFSASASKPTPINLTNHSYFNLAGHDTGAEEIYKHFVMINSDRYTVTDSDSIPTGDFQNVDTTPYDFRVTKELGPAISKLTSHGFDDNFCVIPNETKKIVLNAEVIHKDTGRSLQVFSDQPGVQFYTGNYLPDPFNNIYPVGKKHLDSALNNGQPVNGKNGAKYKKNGAFCLETQKYPDAVNHANFATVTVNPGETYRHELIYQFGF